jgi:hypothetical protein
MASEGGSDPSEDAAKLFAVTAVTESLVGAGIAPSIHLGRGIIVSALSKSTARATIENSVGHDTCRDVDYTNLAATVTAYGTNVGTRALYFT